MRDEGLFSSGFFILFHSFSRPGWLGRRVNLSPASGLCNSYRHLKKWPGKTEQREIEKKIIIIIIKVGWATATSIRSTSLCLASPGNSCRATDGKLWMTQPPRAHAWSSTATCWPLRWRINSTVASKTTPQTFLNGPYLPSCEILNEKCNYEASLYLQTGSEMA